MFASFKINLILQEAEGADIFPKWIAVVVKLIIFRLIEMDWKKYSGLTFFGFRLFLLGRLILKIRDYSWHVLVIIEFWTSERWEVVGAEIWRKLKNHQIVLKYFNNCLSPNSSRKLLYMQTLKWKENILSEIWNTL